MKHSDLKQSNMSSFIYLLIYSIQRPVWHYILPPGHWVQAVGSHHRLMSTYREVMGPVRAPYRAQHLKCPQWSDSKPWLSNQEFGPLTARLT